jgi:hypothetical protein
MLDQSSARTKRTDFPFLLKRESLMWNRYLVNAFTPASLGDRFPDFHATAITPKEVVGILTALSETHTGVVRIEVWDLTHSQEAPAFEVFYD